MYACAICKREEIVDLILESVIVDVEIVDQVSSPPHIEYICINSMSVALKDLKPANSQSIE